MNTPIYKTILLLFSCLLFSCQQKKNPVAATTKETLSSEMFQLSALQFKQSEMAIGGYNNISFPSYITVNGAIDVPPENRAILSTTMGGYILNTPFLVGDTVKKGQLLVTLENPEFLKIQQQFLETKAVLKYLEADFERQKTMWEENISSKKAFLKAESDYKTALATFSGLEKQLELLHIATAKLNETNMSAQLHLYAPITGSITKVNITKGKYIFPATEILEIIDHDHIHLELSVFEKDILSLKKGQSISFKVPEVSQESFAAKVHLIGGSLNEDRTIKVHAHLANESEHFFLTGMFVTAQIFTDMNSYMALPIEAVVAVDDKFYVLEVTNKENQGYFFEKREVNVGASNENYIAIISATPEQSKKQFLTKGAFDLLAN